MRDKQKHNFESDDREAELMREADHENADAELYKVWATIPNAKPAIRPKTDDAKMLSFLKAYKLMPHDSTLDGLRTVLDGDDGGRRAKLLEDLKSLPTTQSVKDSYKWLAYSLTFKNEGEPEPSLFNFHQTVAK